MKKSLVIASLCIAVFGFAFIGQTHAEEDSDHSTKTESVKERTKSNRKAFEESFENITKYLKTDLTREDKTAIKEILEAKKNEIESVNETTKALIASGGKIDTGVFIGKLTNIYSGFQSAMLPYIAENKVSAFNTFISEKIKRISTNRNLKAEKQNTIQEKKKAELEKKKAQKEKEIERKEKKFIQDLIKKIGDVLKKVKTQTLKDALIGARTTLQNQVGTGSTRDIED